MRRPVVLVVPFLLGSLRLLATAAPLECQPAPEQALAALNALRAEARNCGTASFKSAGALRWDANLAGSARLYAQELARRDTVSHDGLVSPSLSDRIRASGYAMGSAAENLAAGQEDLDELLHQWLDSPVHCANLMGANYEDVGLACARGPGIYGYYWVLHLGRHPTEWQPPIRMGR